MSKLSCETFKIGDLCVKISNLRNAVDVSFEHDPIVHTGPNTASVSFNGNLIDGGYTYGYTYGYTSNVDIAIAGFRFYIQNGYLKALKKEVSATHRLSFDSARTVIPREYFCHPASVWESVCDPTARFAIQKAISDLADSQGIVIPKKFLGNATVYAKKGEYPFAALDWLAYPLVREIDSTVLCKNLLPETRSLISPKFEPMNFKQLVEHYYGTSTPKMLEELWKNITTGGDVSVRHFANDAFKMAYKQHDLDYRNGAAWVIEEHTDRIFSLGDRKLQAFWFSFGPSIFQVLGFDYFYQSVKLFNAQNMREQYRHEYVFNTSNQVFKPQLKILSKHLSPKRVLSLLFPTGTRCDFIVLRDTAQMLLDYEDITSIPKTLKHLYPNGLTVDFKFKNLKELHDKLSIQYTIIKTEATRREIPVHMFYETLDGRNKNGLKLVVPRNTTQLALWGKLLNICVASYGDNAASGNTLLLGVEENHRIKYCIEFRSVVVVSLRGAPFSFAEQPSKAEADCTLDPEVVREPLPMLIAKVGENMKDVQELKRSSFSISLVQFKGERNSGPSVEDLDAVDDLLEGWLDENFGFLQGIEGIWDYRNINIDMRAFNNAMVNAHVPVPGNLIYAGADNARYQMAINNIDFHIDLQQ